MGLQLDSFDKILQNAKKSRWITSGATQSVVVGLLLVVGTILTCGAIGAAAGIAAGMNMILFQTFAGPIGMWSAGLALGAGIGYGANAVAEKCCPQSESKESSEPEPIALHNRRRLVAPGPTFLRRRRRLQSLGVPASEFW